MKMLKKNLTYSLLYIALGSYAVTGCSDDDDDDKEPSSSAGFPTNGAAPLPSGSTLAIPNTQSINLEALGAADSSALYLSSDEKCAGADDRGLFSLALGGACHTSSFASDLLLGETNGGDFNSDRVINCDDFTYAEANGLEAGILYQLTCNDIFQTYAVESLALEEESGGAFGISFADFSGDTNTGVGTWYAGNDDSYPANLRLYTGDSIASLEGMIALDLASSSNGSIWINFGTMEGEVSFDKKSDASNCKSSPSEANCHYQEIKLHNTAPAGGDEAPLGFHLRILADDVAAPTFMIIEGRYNYSALQAAGFSDIDASGTSIREIYFKTAQDGDALWGQFEFYDGSGNAIDWNADILDTILSSDLCMDLTQPGNDGVESCSSSYPDLSSASGVFDGRSAMSLISSSLIDGIDFDTDKPDTNGIR